MYDPNSIAAKWIEGLLNAFCAGLLIHLGLVDLIMVEFNDEKVYYDLKLMILMFLGLFLGTIIMAILAIWA